MGEEIKMCLMDTGTINEQKSITQDTSIHQEPKTDEVKDVELFKFKPLKCNPVDKKETARVNLKDYQSSLLGHIEKKHAFRNFDRYVNMHRREFEEELRTKKALEGSALQERKLFQDNELARELDMLKREEFTKAKMRQHLRENTSELRDLERKLKAAYINKELAAQIAQKEAEKVNEKIRQTEARELMKQAWIDQREHQKTLLQEDMIKKAHYKQELQEQLIMREKMKRHLYEEFLKEKKLLDDIVQRIQDEDEREAYERFCRIKKTRAEMIAFKQAQDAWKLKRMEEIEEENRRIEDYLMTKTAGVQARQLEQARKEAEREKVIEKIATQICEQREKQREREEIIADLQQEEQRAIVEKRHRDDVEKQLRIRIENQKYLAQQMEDRKERHRREAEEDKKYKEELTAKLAEDARLEQLSDQRKRMKMLQLKRDVEQMMKERRQKRAEEFQSLIEIEREEQRDAERRRRIIEEERITMLQEHVKNLIGYLPKGLLKVEDLAHLSEDIVTHVVKGDPSTMSTTTVRYNR